MTTGFATGELAVGICDRCHMRRPYMKLGPDGDKPGLIVCQDNGSRGCSDEKDPWRLPPRQPEPIALRNARPDVGVDNEESALLGESYDSAVFITEDGTILKP